MSKLTTFASLCKQEQKNNQKFNQEGRCKILVFQLNEAEWFYPYDLSILTLNSFILPPDREWKQELSTELA